MQEKLLSTVTEGEEEEQGLSLLLADAAPEGGAGTAAAGAAPLICLADQLASTCGDSQILKVTQLPSPLRQMK